MYGNNHIIAISTICDTFDKLLYFKDTIIKIDNKLENETLNYINTKNNNIIKPNILPRDAFYSEKVLIQLNLSLNKICGDFITPYPPGIPILTPGEIITQDIINKINEYLKNNINIIGINENNEISVIEML